MTRIRRFPLDRLLDYFIPAQIQVNPVAHRRARMFMLSHSFGPILGNTLPLYLYAMDICRDYRVGVFFASILAFWIYPILLRVTGRFQLLAFISVQNLIFCVFWACFAFGGLASPFLPWILIFPLLAFLYLPTTGTVRNALLAQISINFAIGISVLMYAKLPPIDLASLQLIGIISMAAVAAYFAMMSLYFARMFHDERAFARELDSLISTADSVRNLTASANQASAAKADFVASMSHELRTPLNAIIGYSQLLVDEAEDENDRESLADLVKINNAGAQLLRLIDDILDFSRIEAGRMPVTKAFGTPASFADLWIDAARRRMGGKNIAIVNQGGEAVNAAFNTDWNLLGSAIRLVAAACAGRSADGTLQISFSHGPGQELAVSIADFGIDGICRTPVPLREEFDSCEDSSATKYGAVGIEMALAAKFAKLIGGQIKAVAIGEGILANQIIVPDDSASRDTSRTAIAA